MIGVMPAQFSVSGSNPAFLIPMQFDRNKAILGEFGYSGHGPA